MSLFGKPDFYSMVVWEEKYAEKRVRISGIHEKRRKYLKGTV